MNLVMFVFVALIGSVFAQNTPEVYSINSQCLENANSTVVKKENAFRAAMRDKLAMSGKKDENYDMLSEYEVEDMGPSSNSGFENLKKSIDHFLKETDKSKKYEITVLQGFVDFLNKKNAKKNATVLGYTFTFSTVDKNGKIIEGDNASSVDYAWFALIKNKSSEKCLIEFSQYRYRYEYDIFN